MNWTTDKPTAPGWYWVAWPEGWKPGVFDVAMVLVERCDPLGEDGALEATGTYMDYSDPLDDERWTGCLWQGPIEAPAAPTEKG